MNHFEEYIKKEIEIMHQLDLAAVENIANAMLACYERGGNVFICGNGGSAASASHITGDFIKGASYGLEKRWKFMCLNDNITSMMALANDISYDDIFVEPLKNYASSNDLFIGISGSGNSANVVKAMEYAKEKGLQTVAFCGFRGGKIKDLADFNVYTPIMDMQITEDLHMMALHMIFQYIVKKLFGASTNEKTMGGVYDKRVQ